MNRQHYLETIEVVLAWDLPEEALADAINQQLTQSVSFEEEYAWDLYQHFSLLAAVQLDTSVPVANSIYHKIIPKSDSHPIINGGV